VILSLNGWDLGGWAEKVVEAVGSGSTLFYFAGLPLSLMLSCKCSLSVLIGGRLVRRWGEGS